MKKIIIMLLLTTISLALTSCSEDVGRDVVGETTYIVETTNVALGGQSEAMRDFYALARDKNADLASLATYVKYNIGGLPKDEADEMILVFEAIQVKMLPSIQERFDSIEMQVLFRPYRLRDLRAMDVTGTGVMRELELLSTMGLQIEQAEGSFFPVINYGFYEWFTPYASAEVRMYFDLMKAESDYAPQKDGGLTISWDEVLTRALAFESFVMRYPAGELSTRASERFDLYRALALEGSINTPLFDRNTLEMRQEAVLAYKAFSETLESKKMLTGFEKMILEYVASLKESGFIKNEKIAFFIGSNR